MDGLNYVIRSSSLQCPFPEPEWTSLNWSQESPGILKVRSGGFHFIAARNPLDPQKMLTSLDKDVYPDYLRWPPEIEVQYSRFKLALAVIWEGTLLKILSGGEPPKEEFQK